MPTRRVTAALWAAAICGAAMSTSAMAQGGLCGDPQGFCQRFMKPECVTRLGAGSLALDAPGSDCAGQLDAYRTCIAAAAETCGPTAAAPLETQSCDAEDARTLWAELKTSTAPEELDAFAEACASRPQAALAQARAARLREGGGSVATASTDVGPVGGIYSITGSSVQLQNKLGVTAKGLNRGYVPRGAIVKLRERGAGGQFVLIDVLSVSQGSSLRAARGWIPADALRPAPASAAPAPLEAGDDALVQSYTLTLATQPSAEASVLASKGWVKRGTRIEVLERFEDAQEGVFIRFALKDVVDGSQPKADGGWTPAANLKKIAE